ncbi:cobalt/nickel transport system permease protein [Natronincola ferrireducens]|uniref:Cobalt/nickel transport system permease protein n=2 Tax=Natronincola ferrireducens TaxID=393762 RepID=A0A1G9FQI5_9FIRM|nr:cobalt/nickel transport system permease protein [Natronincola ferrireducens]
MVSLFILLFYISFIDSYRLLAITAGIAVVYSISICKSKYFIRLIKPVLPFVILMLLPIIIRYILRNTLEDIDFTIMIIGKILISSIILGTVVAKHSALYLVDGILNIGLPRIFNRILALTFRYFHMINEDVQIGRKALSSRGMGERKGLSSLSIFGEWIGGFFLKSTHHSDMVFNAMKSRGFQGESRNEKIKNKGLIIECCILILFLTMVLIIDGKV